MNEVIKALLERRSIRKFKPETPPRETLEQIIEAGLYAPSGFGRQDVIIVAVTDPALRKRLTEENRRIGGWDESVDPFYGAPVILIVLAEAGWRNRIYDGSLVMGNMLLAAHALGLGGVWINRAREEFEQQQFKDLLKDLGVEGEWEGVGHCAIGWPACEPPAPAPRKENRVFWAE